jgi:hypothetical protein
MEDVETYARFLAPKYISCYTDVLKQYLESTGQSDLLPRDLDLNVLLEFGVPAGTAL